MQNKKAKHGTLVQSERMAKIKELKEKYSFLKAQYKGRTVICFTKKATCELEHMYVEKNRIFEVDGVPEAIFKYI